MWNGNSSDKIEESVTYRSIKILVVEKEIFDSKYT
jgi:hypothetical protein